MPSRTLSREGPPPVSRDLNSFRDELRYAGNRSRLIERGKELQKRFAGELSSQELEIVKITGRPAKKWALRFSESIAQKAANALRKQLKEIRPHPDGQGHQSLSRGPSGLMKLDVNYSTQARGLRLAIAIKTLSFADGPAGRFTKDVTRVGSEIRDEARECHSFHPYAVFAAFWFMPVEAAFDSPVKSSVKHAAEALEALTGRDSPRNVEGYEKIEVSFMALYEDDGRVTFCPPNEVPASGQPVEGFNFTEALSRVNACFKRRNAH
jgi:hypothetical protein